MAALSYDEVLNRWDNARAFGEQRSLPEYAQHLNDIYNTQDFSAGLNDGPWTRFSHRADEFLGNTVGQLTEPVGEAVGSLFGNAEAGARVGRSLPRALLETAPLYLLGPEAGAPATAAALAGTGGLMAAHTYADTGSPKAALISGLTGAALPGIGHFGGGLAAKLAGASRVSGEWMPEFLREGMAPTFSALLPETAADVSRVETSRFLGSQLAQFAGNEASMYAMHKTLDPNSPFDPLSADFLLQQIPFTVHDAVSKFNAPKPTAAEVRPGLQAPTAPAPETKPYVPPVKTEQSATLQQAMDNFEQVQSDVNSTAEQREAALQALVKTNLNPKGVEEVKDAVTGTPTEPATVGLTAHPDNVDKLPNGNYRVRVDSYSGDESDVPGHQTMFVNGVEPKMNALGKLQFEGPQSAFGPATHELPDRRVVADPNQPELPFSGNGDLANPTKLSAPDVQNLTDMGVPAEKIEEFVNAPAGPRILSTVLDEGGGKYLFGPEWNSPHQKGEGNIFEKNIDEASGLGKSAFLIRDEQGNVRVTQDREEAARIAELAGQRAKGTGPLQSEDLVRQNVLDPKAQVKQSTAQFEKARQTEAEARVDANTPIVDSKQIISVLGTATPKVKPAIDEKLTEGATASQAVTHQILSEASGDVHESQVEQEVQKDEVAKVLNLGLHGQEATKYGGALLDESGKRLTFPSESAALEYLAEHQRTHPEDKSDYEIRNAGGGIATDKFRGFYLAPKEGVGVSADATRGGSTLSLNDMLQDYSHEESQQQGLLDSLAEDLTDRPEASLELYLRNLDVASRSPQVFAREADLDLPDAMRAIRQARVVLSGNADKTLAEINSALEKAGIPKFENARDYAQTMASVREGLEAFSAKFTKPTLGSTFPADPKIVEALGVSRGPKSVLQFIANQKFGLLSDFAKSFLQHGQILDQLTLVLPGTANWEAGQTFYQPSLTGGEMNLSYLPNGEYLHRWVQDFMHETLHHFEDQLAGRTDEAAMKYKETRTQILETLRNSPLLPKKIRDYVQTIEARGDYEKYASADQTNYTVMWKKDLGAEDYGKYAGILYGLQNEEEMVAQLFSDKNMQALAFKTQVPKNQGIWQNVVHWFSEVLGRYAGIPNNAMTEILKGFDNYLTGGVLKKTYNGGDFIRDSLITKYGTRPEALASRMQSVDQMYSRGNLQASISGFQREMENGLLHPDQPTGPIVQSLRTALVSGEAREVFHGTMNLLAAEVPVHQELWYRMKQDFELTRDLYAKVKTGEIPGAIPEEVQARMRASGQKLNAMKQALDKQALALDRWNSLDQFDREGYEESVIGSLAGKKFAPPLGETGDEEQARAVMGLADEPELARVKRESSLAQLQQGKGAAVGDWLRRMFMLTQFLKRQIPEFRLAADHVADQQTNAFSRMAALNSAYEVDPKTGAPSPEVLESNRRVATTPTLYKAASEIKLWIQEQEKEGVQWKMDDAFPKSVLSKLSPKDREAVVLEHNSANARHKVWTEQTVPQFFAEHNREQTARVITAREPGMKPQQGRDLAQQMYDSLAMLQNPETNVQGMEGLRMLSSQMQPQTYLSALGLSQGLISDANAHIQFMRSRSNYVTEQRLGKYHMRMTGADGKPIYTDSDSKQELDARRIALEKQGAKFNYFVPKSEANGSAGIDSDLMSKLQELDSQAYNRVAQALVDRPDIAALVLPETQRANDYAQSVAALAPVPGAGQPTRKFVAGREYINMVNNDHQFYVRANNWMRHKLTRAYTDVDSLDPVVQGNSTVRDLIQQHVQNNLSPDNPIARKLNEATYFTKLAWNFGVNFLHGIQSLTTGMASVISETGSVADAFEVTAKAQKALTQRVLTKKWANPEHEWLMNMATSEGAKGLATWNDIFDPERAVTYDSNNPTTLAGKALNTAKWAARSWTGMFMSMNDQIGLLAGYDLARSRGMSQEDAYAFAKDVKDRGYYTGGKAQRGVGLWSIQSKAVPQLLSSLQTYTFGWFSQLADNWSSGFGKAPEGLTPTQRLGAKKAFLYQLGAQAVLAGALGLPGVGQGMALMKQMTGVDAKGWVQQNLASLFDEDQTNGGLISALALHGAVASFSPIDPSMRHMPSFPFIGVSPYKGFDIATLAPAPVSTASDVVQGMMAAVKGDLNTLAQKALPHVLQGPYKLWQGEGDIRDKRGTLLYKLSPAERFVEALGMEPSRVSQARDTAEAVKTMQEKQQALLGSLADDLAATQRHSGVDAARDRLRQIVQDNPGIDPVKLASAAVNRLEAQSVPFNVQRNVNPALDLTGLTSQNPPQETERLHVRQQGQQSFGLKPQGMTGSAEASAQATDAVLASNPFLPVSQARQVASGKARVPRPYSGLDILGTQ